MTLRDQLIASTSAVLDQLPGIRDGDVSAIHDARVATRRIRAVLPIVSAGYPQADLKRAGRTAHRAGQALGRVRDLDVAIELIGELEHRSPAAAGCAAELRRSIAAQQVTARRRLVKEFENLPLVGLTKVAARLPQRRWPISLAGRQECDGPIRDALRERAVALRHAVEHSSGVYFPKRAHRVRIEAKKLRYVLEMTNGPEAIAPRGLKLLKKTQEELGSLHDRDVLRERFARLSHSSVAAVLAVIDAECQQLFAAYAARRAALLEVCAAVDRFATPVRSVRTAWLLGLASVAVPAAVVLAAGARAPRARLADGTRALR